MSYPTSNHDRTLLATTQSSGVSANSCTSIPFGYLFPATSAPSTALRISASSAGVSFIFAESRFSSKYLIFRVLHHKRSATDCSDRIKKGHLPRNRKDVIALRQQPGQRQLSGRTTFFTRDLLQQLRQHEVCGQVLGRKARHHAAQVNLRLEVGVTAQLARDEPLGQRRIRRDRDAELAAGVEEAEGGIFDLDAVRAVLHLHGRDGVDGMRAAERLGRHFGEPQVLDFALAAFPVSFESLERNGGGKGRRDCTL